MVAAKVLCTFTEYSCLFGVSNVQKLLVVPGSPVSIFNGFATSCLQIET